MASFKPWLKMWVEWIEDDKMDGLSLAEQCAWWRLVTLAQKCGADGMLVKSNGAPLSLDKICNILKIKTKADRKAFDRMVSYMIEEESLHWNADTLVVTNLATRQARIPSETKESVAERVRRYRERKIVTGKPLPPLTTPLKDKDIDIDIETETEIECNGEKPVTCNGKVVTAEAVLAEISKLHEENFSIITPILSEKFIFFAENYRGPLVWIREAFAEAAAQNVRKWAYVEKILENWQAEGREKHGERREQRGTRDEAHQRGAKEPSAERYRQSLKRRGS